MPRDAMQGLPLKSEVLSQPRVIPSTDARFLTAAGKTIVDDEVRSTYSVKVEGTWQQTAWNWFNLIGEYRYSVNWVGNLLSKAKLTVLKDGKPTQDAVAVQALTDFYGGPEGQQELLRNLGIHFTVAGEAYVIAAEDADGNDDWLVAAAVKVSNPAPGQWKVGEETFQKPLVIRLWRPHPMDRKYSDSPSRAVLPVLAEIDGYVKHTQATTESRLSSAGILVVPSEITFAGSKAVTDENGLATTTADNNAQGLLDEIQRVAALAISNRGDAGALVPILLQVAGEYVDKITHLTFWGKYDDSVKDRMLAAVRRLALGMDMPPEVLEGTADMNHWSSWQVEEAAIKSHTEPLLAVIGSAITSGYLRPALMTADADEGAEKMTMEEAEHYSIGIDTTALRLRPNRSQEAIELYDRGVLNMAALIRECGFEDTDIMDDVELETWFTKKVASGSTTPDLVAAALEALNIRLRVTAGEAGLSTNRGNDVVDGKPQQGPGTQEARPTPSLTEHPKRVIPKGETATEASALMVHRALERAGNRLRTKMHRQVKGVSADKTYQHVAIEESDLDYLLTDSWGICEQYAPRWGMSTDELTAKLDGYTRGLLLGGGEIDHVALLHLITDEG